MRIIFFGSSEFSVPPFELCLASPHQVVAAVTTPDRPKGRGLQVQPNPLKERSEKAGILTLPFASLKNPDAQKQAAYLNPDIFVVASYGKLIPDAWLRIPKKLALNIHPSLLPKHRGAAPITWQILEGDKETGVSIAEVTPALDAGDIFHQMREPLREKETTATLTRHLSQLSVKALEIVLNQIEKGSVNRAPQKGPSSYAKKLTKEDGRLDLSEPAEILDRKIRAFDPWPGAFIGFQGEPLRLIEAIPGPASTDREAPGTLLEISSDGFLRIQTGQGSLKIFKVQKSGRQVISGQEFANGQRLKPGFIFEKLL